jgi:hypothetical protein
MLQLCKQADPNEIDFVHANWLDQSIEYEAPYDLVLADITHYFLSFPDGWLDSFTAIKNMMNKGAVFLSRQICFPDKFDKRNYLDLLDNLKTDIRASSGDQCLLLNLISEYKSIVVIMCAEASSPIIDCVKSKAMTAELEKYLRTELPPKQFDDISSIFLPSPAVKGVNIIPQAVPQVTDIQDVMKSHFSSVAVDYDQSLPDHLCPCFPIISAIV